MELKHYDHPSQFEPLWPHARIDELRERSRSVVAKSFQLTHCAHPSTIASLRELVRAMNSYYSNRIEGQGTHPANIESALRKKFSDKPDIARLQRIALAHIEAEQELECRVEAGASALTAGFLQEAHSALYSRLSTEDRTSPDGHVVEPGEWRKATVAVGRHEPPSWEAVPAFLSRLDEVYGCSKSLDDMVLVAALAHHRTAWIHPFLDGNGRAVRLQTHCALWGISGGMWSVSRGMARSQEAYYAKLDAADSPRMGDLDGRGNLSDKMLANWCSWFIEVANDQVSFMTRMLNLDEMKQRITALVTFRAQQDKGYRPEGILPLYHMFATGPMARGEFQQMTGLGERSARSLLSSLIESGLVASDSHVAPVRFAFPLDSLQFLLPDLYPEAATRQTDAR